MIGSLVVLFRHLRDAVDPLDGVTAEVS